VLRDCGAGAQGLRRRCSGIAPPDIKMNLKIKK
jgi:hypothetical protein